MRRLREHGPLNVEARPKSYPVLSRGLKTIPACHCTIFTEGRSTWARPLCRREGPRSGHSSIPISHFEVDHILLNNGGGRRRLGRRGGAGGGGGVKAHRRKKTNNMAWDHAEEQEYRNLIRALGGSLPAEVEVILMEDSLRQTAKDRKAERLKHWREWLKRAWAATPRKVYGWLQGGGGGGPPTSVGD